MVWVRVIAAAAFVTTLGPYAWSDDTGTVEGTVAVTGGALSMSTPDVADLGSESPDGDLTNQLGAVSVVDRRGDATAAWVATVTSSGFTTGAGGAAETISASVVDYWSGPATTTVGDGSFVPGQATPGAAVPLSSAPVAFALGGGSGGNSASWSPTLVVHIPFGSVAGAYSGSVVHSVT
jgi:hypothetical protein